MASRTRIVDEAVELIYFMRGSINYNEMWETTYHERQRISNFIEKRLKDESAKPVNMARVY